jgi:uncharacterized protein involved in exopolysaccharide biosynthesis
VPAQGASPNPLAALQASRSPIELCFDLLDRVRRRWWLVALLAVIVPSWVAWRALEQPVFHESQIVLLLDPRPPRVVDKVTEVVAEEIMGDSDRFAAGQMRLLASTYLSDLVEQRLAMPKGSLAGRVIATLDARSHVITLEIDDLDPARAQRYVQAFADAYIENTVAQRAGVATDATRFLDGEAEDLRRRLELDEQALYHFNRSNELLAGNFDESHRIASSNLEKYHSQQAIARSGGIKLRAPRTIRRSCAC